ncbi:MAG: triose-phosphate isomerase [Actinobacteria bacterium]|nr:triose-phosphate isomerase [Actinomycetota bacterium]
MSRTPLMAGNWKMNVNHLEAIALVQKLAYMLNDEDYANLDVAVCAPFTDLRSVQTLIEADKYGIKYGAQDLSQYDKGAYTGDISGVMLAKLGCSFVIVGHSERRQYHAESDEIVNAKTKAALRNEVTPIVCVGEGLDIRKAGDQVSYTLAQVDGALTGLTAEQVAGLVIAYEPVWAIGTGEVATPDDAQEVCGAIRTRVAELYDAPTADAVRVLYGGSMKSDNVASIMAQPDVDGGLVGGASLDPDEFVAVCRYRLHG